MISSPAFYEERIRTLKFAFADALLALEELNHTEVAERLRMRWPEAAPRAVNREAVQTTRGTEASSYGL